MIDYHVRSRDLVDIVNDINAGKIVISPYFQRKLVWRLGHKIDFIKTILLGFPFPEIFIARGTLDVETMESTSCIVDGQQRMNAIREYLAGAFEVDGRPYSTLTPQEKEGFLRYEIAIIDLNLQNNAPEIIEIFKRLNRTFYALSNTEKMATEFASSEFMLVGKLIAGEFQDDNSSKNIEDDFVSNDPNVTEDFFEWANARKLKAIHSFALNSSVFSKYEISRKVHLMFTLNLMATALGGYYNRNDRVKDYLDEKAQAFPEKDEICDRLNTAAATLGRLRLRPAAFWNSKSTSFSVLLVLDELRNRISDIGVPVVKQRLEAFSETPGPEYALAAKEGVNNKKERLTRYEALKSAILQEG